MNQNLKITTPRYQQIATDIASKIASGHYKEGNKIYARSALASQYNVSSETARRAISILYDMDIVKTIKGSGVVVTSQENAVKFIKQYTDIETINDLKRELLESVERQNKECTFLKDNLLKLIDKTDRFKSINPFVPFEVTIDSKMKYLGQSISDINFWHNTSATIVAIKRGGALLMSPGPYAVLIDNDIVYFVGDENCHTRVMNFLYDDEKISK